MSACAGAAPSSSPAKPPIPTNEDVDAPAPSPSPAQTLLGKTLEGFGGAERVDRLRSLVVESTTTRTTPSGQQAQIRQRSYVEFPDRFRHEAIIEDMTVVSVIAPGGDYCPDAPITRGQMAAFFAKTLGLHWPAF